WHEWEAVSWDNERAGTRMALGQAMRPIAKLDRCHTIVALDCDLFVEHPAALRYSRDFAKSRRPSGSLGGFEMNRLWAVESTFTGTGALADHRLPLRSELVLPLLMELDASLSGGAAPGAEFLREPKIAQFVSVLVEELKANRGALGAGRRPASAARGARVGGSPQRDPWRRWRHPGLRRGSGAGAAHSPRSHHRPRQEDGGRRGQDAHHPRWQPGL
ncbi:MAG: hypothetical protein HC863_01245, partial [Myxococcales bacterium]|nr:hypothetical protein [Myxococcales bacterium]